MRKLKTIEEFKVVSEFFPAGAQVPARIMFCDSPEDSSNMKFVSDTWVLKTTNDYVCAVDSKSSGMQAVICFTDSKDMTLVSGVAKSKGTSFFIGNKGKTDDEWIASLNKRIK